MRPWSRGFVNLWSQVISRVKLRGQETASGLWSVRVGAVRVLQLPYVGPRRPRAWVWGSVRTTTGLGPEREVGRNLGTVTTFPGSEVQAHSLQSQKSL